MSAGNKKMKSIDSFKRKVVSGKLTKEKPANGEEAGEMTEVDDKLIGDDLDIKQAQVPADEEIRLEKEENNY